MKRSLWVLAFPGASAGCSGPLSTLDPAGPAADSIALLWWIMLWAAAAIFIIVMAIFTTAILWPGSMRRVPRHVWLIHGGLVIPGILLLLLLVAALTQGERLLARALPEPALRIEVEARMWSWTFSYPNGPVTEDTFNVLHMPVGQPVDLIVTSSDVIHSFWIPRLGGKIDAIPGRTTVVRLQADHPGTYHGLCAEFCGAGHTIMLFTAEARRPTDPAAASEQRLHLP